MKDYIGDGVYVEFDGFGIEVRANSPDNPESVYLEPQVLEALIRFAKRCFAEPVPQNKKRKNSVTERRCRDEKRQHEG